jgi:hypothetical protein
LSKLAREFEEIEFTHLAREGNQFADVLATLVVTPSNYNVMKSQTFLY